MWRIWQFNLKGWSERGLHLQKCKARQRWEFIKENQKVRKKKVFLFFLVEGVFSYFFSWSLSWSSSCFLTFLFSFINSHLRSRGAKLIWDKKVRLLSAKTKIIQLLYINNSNNDLKIRSIIIFEILLVVDLCFFTIPVFICIYIPMLSSAFSTTRVVAACWREYRR